MFPSSINAVVLLAILNSVFLDTIEDLEAKLDRHKYYTTNLETLMRLLYNDKISADKINDVRDHVEYYVENNDDGLFLSFLLQYHSCNTTSQF